MHMHKIVTTCFLMGFAFSLIGAPSADEDAPVFPITISCKDPNNPDKMLNLSLSPTKKIARLKYYAPGMENRLSLSVNEERSFYGSAYVTIDSRSSYYAKTLTISANMNEVYRVTRSVGFSISFDQGDMLMPKELVYHSGVVEFDGDAPTTIDLSTSNLMCTVSGL